MKEEVGGLLILCDTEEAVLGPVGKLACFAAVVDGFTSSTKVKIFSKLPTMKTILGLHVFGTPVELCGFH